MFIKFGTATDYKQFYEFCVKSAWVCWKMPRRRRRRWCLPRRSRAACSRLGHHFKT